MTEIQELWRGNPVCDRCGWRSVLGPEAEEIHTCPDDGIKQLMARIKALGERVNILERKDPDRCCCEPSGGLDRAVCDRDRAQDSTFCRRHDESRAATVAATDRRERMGRRFGREEDR